MFVIGPAQFGEIASDPLDPPNHLHLARSDGGGGAGTSTARALHSSSTILMLENALAAVRNDVSQLPLSYIMHASTVIRDLENVLRERLSRGLGDDEEMEVSAGTTIEKE